MTASIGRPAHRPTTLAAGLLPPLLSLLLFATLPACTADPSNSAQGYVEGEYAYIASPYGGRLEALLAQRGQNINRDSPLFRLEAVEETSAFTQAEQQLAAEEARLTDMEQGQRPDELDVLRARLTQAQAEEKRSARQCKRDEAQFKTGAISQAQLEQSRATYEADSARVREYASQLAVGHLPARSDQVRAQQAAVTSSRAQLARARWQLAQKMPAATQNALVVDTLYRVGEWVPPGAPVVKLLPPEQIKVRFFVPEPRLASLQIGQTVHLQIDGLTDEDNKEFPCTISYVAPESEYTPPVIYSNETRTKLIFLIEARPALAAAPLLHPGQPVTVILP